MHAMTIGQSTLVQPVSAVDPGFVQLLLNFNQTNGATAIVDESRFARTLTGDAYCCVSTAQSKWGTGSLKITNTAQEGLYIAPHADFGYSSGAKWTIDFWLLVDTWPSSATEILAQLAYAPSSISAQFGFNNASPTLHTIENVGGGQSAGSGTFAIGTWQYIAIEDDGTNTTVYLNGAVDRVDSIRAATGSNSVNIGGYHGYGPAGSSDGTVVYLDGWRLTIGKNLYGGTHTPPVSAPTVMV